MGESQKAAPHLCEDDRRKALAGDNMSSVSQQKPRDTSQREPPRLSPTNTQQREADLRALDNRRQSTMQESSTGKPLRDGGEFSGCNDSKVSAPQSNGRDFAADESVVSGKWQNDV